MPSTHTIPIPIERIGLVSRTENGPPEQATVISTRGSGDEQELYVHFVAQDKRMDRWIKESEFSPLSNEPRKRKRSDNDSDAEDGFTMVVTEEEYDLDQHKKIGAQRNFDRVLFGQWAIRTWYFSPYPLVEGDDIELPAVTPNGQPATTVASVPKIPGVRHTAGRSHARVLDLLAGSLTRVERPMLWVCEYCFKYMSDPQLYEAHQTRCTVSRPPGRRIYHKGACSVWEVDGAKEKLYCQNLALFGKLFIDVKTLFFDCDNFMFYVATESDSKYPPDSQCHHFCGFFSKEKLSFDDYNLACIVTLPPRQRKGWGMLMIEISYELSYRANKVGTPERPLSDLGLRSYLAYWVATLLRFFRRILTVVVPFGASVTKELDGPRSPSHDREEAGTPSVVNGNTPGVVTAKRRKRAPTISSSEVNDAEALLRDEEQRTSRIAHILSAQKQRWTANSNGTATVNAEIQLTIKEIAQATHLRVDDTAFALSEIGLLGLRLASEDEAELRRLATSPPEYSNANPNTFVFISRATVDRLIRERRIKIPSLNLMHYLDT
ncbi:Histone acetyltransferase [Mycena indigotica]|uniref:histone acetyltransferase n=1 Tax=Mycena indigotica TaxID=2126181 RepID=A0A8H6SRU8_9AGAR|nr:Histone acetyltransferase [Mycena indigotica]KAF7303742.1 Histone acetyltransferase [Mycena indigotica]